MQETDFNAQGRMWSTTLCDGTSTVIKMDSEGNAVPLKYEDRQEYCDKVREIRMSEGTEQVMIRQYTLHEVSKYMYP